VVTALGGGDCERIGSGWLAQPANAVSSLTFVAVGIWLLWRRRASGSGRGVSIAAGGAMISVGVGSFAYHGPQPAWAHAAHNASILVLVLVMIGDHIWLTVRAGVAAVLKAWRPATGWIAVALVAYWAGRTDSRFCSPSAVAQPHAAWHVLIAIGLGSYCRPSCDFRP
jgi:hypothetical protein